MFHQVCKRKQDTPKLQVTSEVQSPTMFFPQISPDDILLYFSNMSDGFETPPHRSRKKISHTVTHSIKAIIYSECW